MAWSKEYKKYKAHFHNAKKRQIEFYFTFEEWVLWWENNLGIDWLQKRGRKCGQYVMARKGDKGPYHPDNVECITCTNNNIDQARNGLTGFKTGYHGFKNKRLDFCKRGHKLDKKKALRIYHSKGTQKTLALKYGVSERMIRLIKNKQAWVHVF